MYKQTHLSDRGSNVPFLFETTLSSECTDCARWERHLPYLKKKKDDDSICEEQEESVGQEILLSLRKMAEELKIAHKYTYSNCTFVFKISLPAKHSLSPHKWGETFPRSYFGNTLQKY
jgi:hypothetical protein